MRTIKIVALLFLPACSTVQFAADDNYREELKRYVGKSIDLVVNSIGHADYTSSAPNGNKLYVYTRSGFNTGDQVLVLESSMRFHANTVSGVSSE